MGFVVVNRDDPRLLVLREGEGDVRTGGQRPGEGNEIDVVGEERTDLQTFVDGLERQIDWLGIAGELCLLHGGDDAAIRNQHGSRLAANAPNSQDIHYLPRFSILAHASRRATVRL